MEPVYLETTRLLLRGWRDADRDAFFRMNADPRVMRYFPARLSRPESDALMDRIVADLDRQGFGLYAVQMGPAGDFIGFVGLWVPNFEARFMPAVEIGWRLAPRYWNRGLATEGARAVVRHAFGPLGLTELVSMTVPANLGSRRVMEKIGMTRDPADDFDHPKLPDGHPLKRHVLYRIRKASLPPGESDQEQRDQRAQIQ
jgi:RimJ/RimL family protein N-acetyltransferase